MLVLSDDDVAVMSKYIHMLDELEQVTTRSRRFATSRIVKIAGDTSVFTKNDRLQIRRMCENCLADHMVPILYSEFKMMLRVKFDYAMNTIVEQHSTPPPDGGAA